MLAFSTRWLGLDRPALGQAARLILAAWLAFAIAASLHIQNAYWAAMAIWVVAQPSRGLLLEKATARMAGTLLGAGLGFAILRLSANPYVALALVCALVGAGGGLTHLLRGPLSYGALMAGMTAAVVVLPSVLAPEHSLEIAVARVECTLIGVAVVTLVTGFFTPGAQREAFYRRARRLAGDALAFAALAVAGGAETAAMERQVLAEMSDIDAAAGAVAAASPEGYRRLRPLNALIVAALSVMAAARAVEARRARGEAPPEGLAQGLEAMSRQLRGEAAGDMDLPWYREDQAWLGQAEDRPELRRLAAALARLTAAEVAVVQGARAEAGETQQDGDGLAPHRDWRLARWTALVGGVSTFVVASLGYASGWPMAELVALGVCIFSVMLGSMPMPQKLVPFVLSGATAGVAFAVLYRLAIQPHVDTTGALLLSVLPFFVLGGLARASPRTTKPALDANMCFMLASQAGMPAAAATEVFGGAAALLAGIALVCGGFLLLPRRPDRQAMAVAELIRRDLERLASRALPAARRDWHPRAARQILRMMLHLRQTDTLGPKAPEGLLSALNLGHAIAALQELSASPAGREARQALQALTGFAQAPERAAARLSGLAARMEAAEVARCTEAAVDALRGARHLLGAAPQRAA